MKINSAQIDLLIKDINSFHHYLELYYKKEKFSGPSIYFYRKVIDLIRNSKNYEALLTNDKFIEYIYATLTSWGMHRMGPKGAKLIDFDDFKKSVLANKKNILELKKYEINKISKDELESIKPKLIELFNNISIMQGESKLVGNSKVIHNLLPDLVPLIDRQYTLRFFYGNLNSKTAPGFKKDKEAGIFIEIIDSFRQIADKFKLSLSDFDLKKSFNTSIPKIIDNVIIGLVQSKK